MFPSWTISRIDEDPHFVLHHWQALEVEPTGPCHVPAMSSRVVTFAGCTDRRELIHFSQEIVRFDPTRLLAVNVFGKVYLLDAVYGFTKQMHANSSRSFWRSTNKPRDVTPEVVAMLGV